MTDCSTTQRHESPQRGPVAILIWGVHGGAFANLATALAGGLTRAGSGPVHLLYLFADPGSTITVPAEVRLVRLGARRSITSPVALARYLRKHKPRVLITMPTIITLPALVGYRLAGAAVRRATRFVIYQGDTLGSDVAIDHARDLRLRLLPWLARLLYPGADALSTCAPGVVDVLRRDRVPIPGHRARVIANPVDVEAYRRCAKEPAQHPWIADGVGPVITTLGRLVKRKDHPLLLRAVAELRRRGVNVRLVVIGEGPEREASTALAHELGLAEHVSFCGMLLNPHAEIARSDVFVMSSVDEAFCLALVEAMACEVPVVSTDAVGGGPRFILADAANSGQLASGDRELLASALVPRDVHALADRIEQVLRDPDYRGRLGTAARRRADEFSPDAIGREWSEFIDSLCNKDLTRTR